MSPRGFDGAADADQPRKPEGGGASSCDAPHEKDEVAAQNPADSAGMDSTGAGRSYSGAHKGDQDRAAHHAHATDQSQAAQPPAQAPPPNQRLSAREAWERNRLSSAIALCAGVGLLLALPFALRAGAEFFLPVTTALVIAICLVPLLEWLERRGIPSPVAALIALGAFLFVVNTALVLIVVPAADWIGLLPERISQIKSTLEPMIRLYTQAQSFIDGLFRLVTESRGIRDDFGDVTRPGSLFQLFATAAPVVIINVIFGLLVIFFFLSGWTRLRRRTIQGRGSFTGALAIARVIQNVVDATSHYVLTITLINALLGLIVAIALSLMGMPTPFMWGGFVALLNFIPYFGPIIAAILLGLGGLMSFDTIGWAMLPAIIMLSLHLIEANIVTPLVLGERLKLSPLLILVSLSFWTWVWGTAGALLAVPLLIIIQTVLAAAGRPDIAGFLFEAGTLTSPSHDPFDNNDR